ncbi:FemAB family XrtA/PEP-CTERM system-associated protein [Altererythrobacter aquiaggeris]|uniref:FemAB family XrtA/PEP-CTERM system-associated protein n=1 Tax=Aestuarierythrobacter aquiaggeris TaxID=1898396 RepID=UPI003018FB69
MNAPFAMNQTTIAIADLADPAEVRRIEAFVADHGGTPFHRPLWLQAVERGTGQTATGLIAEKCGELTGWLPLTQLHSNVFGRALVSSGFAVGGGVLCGNPAIAGQLCEAAAELAARNGFSSAELRGGIAPSDWQHCTESHCGFERELARDDEGQLLAIPRKQRAEVRKSLKRDLEVTTGLDETERADHYRTYAVSVHNLGTPVFPRSLFDAVLDAFGDDADILTIRKDGQPISSVLSLYHNGAVMPYWGGGTVAARHLRANERMYYELMLHARKRGCTRFDFGRSKTGSGPYHYKKNWGFEPQPLHYANWTAPGAPPRGADPTSAGNAAMINLWKKLPLRVANLIGPHIARGLG